MADSTSQSHGRGAQVPSPSNAPLSPARSGGTPVSFRTDVNRAKTQRWVEAKQYSYDGTDWGDEDEAEEEEARQPSYANQRPGSGSDLGFQRLSGLSGADESRASIGSGGVPFIRPADIYKRMREGQASPQQATESEHRISQSSVRPLPDNSPPPPNVEISNIPPQPTSSHRLGLPELKRLSGFNTDWISGSGSSSSVQHSTRSEQDPSLQHNPSQGFRSVVHQAFDVPETPNSSTGSVERSNSDGTSVVSPVIGARGFNDEKTPTIYEDPGESPSHEGPMFKPGHRRDLSLPSPGNSPSRKPVMTDHDVPPAGQAEMSSQQPQSPSQVEPAKQSLDAGTSSTRASMQLPANAAEKDFPAPLNVAQHTPSDSHGDIPVMLSSTSVTNSPQGTDNDRLREEIIHRLSRENTPADGTQQSQTHAADESRDSQTEASVLQAGGEMSAATGDQPRKSKLERKFSWESSSEEDEPQVSANLTSPPEPEPVMLPQESAPQLDAADHETSDTERAGEKPQLSIIPPVPESSPPLQQIGDSMRAPEAPQETPLTTTFGQSIDESTLLGFRDIMGIKSTHERIQAFSRTRDHFANLDTGLNQWITFMVHENPEVADVMEQSPKLSLGAPRSSQGNRKFPKFTSFSNLASSLNDGTPTNTGHNRRPSGHHLGVNRQNVEQRGKDLLHLSGKAGEAAKGLFAKGRSKFRAGGGADKVSPTTRTTLHFPLKSEGSHGNLSQFSLRNSVTFGNMPLFKSSRTEESTTSARGPHQPSKSLELPHYLQGNFGNNESSSQPREKRLPLSAAAAQRQSQVDYAGDLEQEMISALGLSPIDPRPQPEAGGSSALGSGEVMKGDEHSAQNSLPQSRESAMAPSATAMEMMIDRSLPVVPDLHSGASSALDETDSHAGVRPMSTEESKPFVPPKDYPPKAAPVLRRTWAVLSSDSFEADEQNKPSPPPKDLPTKGRAFSLQAGHTWGQPSICSERHQAQHTELYDNAPSPLQAPAKGLGHFKKRSTSWVPESAPGVASPLRNEVKYSPGTRSSMLSFGRKSSRGTRPRTPAKDLSQNRKSTTEPDGESAMGKLKNFGKKRRASLVSGLQGGQKRAFSRISGMFGRHQDSQHKSAEPELQMANSGVPQLWHAYGSEGPQPTFSDPFAEKPLPPEPGFAPVVHPLPQSVEAQPVPRQRASMPLPPAAAYNNLSSARSYSQSGPPDEIPVVSESAQGDFKPEGGQFRTSTAPLVTEESSARPSQPQAQQEDQPLQPEQHTEPQKEVLPQQEEGHPPVPNSNPNLQSTEPVESGSQNLQSTTIAANNQPPTENTTVSNAPSTTDLPPSQPHVARVARVANDPPEEPVELAITNDKSSEEIVMSPTAYPGQEWAPPMHI